MAINIDINAICPNSRINIKKLAQYRGGALREIGDDGKITNAPIEPDVEQTMSVNIAMCCKNHINENEYDVYVNTERVKHLYEASWLKEYITYDILETAFILHELAHIRYTNFDSSVAGSSEFKASVMNIIEDTRIEYRMSYDFPETSVFFNIILSVVQEQFELNKNMAVLTPDEKKNFEQLMHDLYNFARYNLIATNANARFISEAIPMILLARRGSDMDCDIASEVIANMIKQEVVDDDEDVSIPDAAVQKTSSPIDSEAKEQKEQEFSDGVMKQIADKFFDDDSVQEQIEAQLVDGSDAGTVVSVENKERTSFFLNTVLEHRKEIEATRNVFTRAFTDYKNIMAKDGDLNFMKQQEAYMNSITGEEGNDYQYRKQERVLVDVVLLRDVSGSIGGMATKYAKAVVIFLSALENIQGIRTAQIDFNGQHFTNKTFDGGIEKATINPFSSGGTSIKGAYEEVMRYQFKGKRNIVIVISDGSFCDSPQVIEEYEKTIGRVAKILKYGIGGYQSNGYKTIEVEDIPKEMTQAVIKEGLR